MPKGFLASSLIDTATRSFGPAPRSELMTTVMPKARMTQPATSSAIRPGRPSAPSMGLSRSSHRSIIGPPRAMQMTVPILTKPLAATSSTSMITSETSRCTLPCVSMKPGQGIARCRPCIRTLKGSLPKSLSKKSVTPRCAMARPMSSSAARTASSGQLICFNPRPPPACVRARRTPRPYTRRRPARAYSAARCRPGRRRRRG